MSRTRYPMLGALLLSLAACGGVAWDTEIAETATARRAMLDSVRIGVTTETEFVTRWGPPFQKIREGGRTEFVYRRQEVNSRYVIVTFDYGVAIAARSNDMELCRGAFLSRVPGYGIDSQDTVVAVGNCRRVGAPLSATGRPDGGRGAGTGNGSDTPDAGDDLPVRG